MRDPRRPLRAVSDGDSDHRLTPKPWYERPLTKKVKALAVVAGALGTICTQAVVAGGWISHRVDETITPIVKRELGGIVAAQQAAATVDAERSAAVVAKIDALSIKIDALTAALPRSRKGQRER